MTGKVQQPATALKEKMDCNRFRRVESRCVEPEVGEAGPEKGKRVPGSWSRRLDVFGFVDVANVSVHSRSELHGYLHNSTESTFQKVMYRRKRMGANCEGTE